MSTKRLERTVLEGGRDDYSKHERRRSHRRARVRERAYLQEALLDPETEAPLLRVPVPRYHDDKLGPASRWLAKRAGRPWAKVHGEILRTFDVRTLPGRHIVFDHLLPKRSFTPVYRRWAPDPRRGLFAIDREGILRFEERRGYRPGVRIDTSEVEAFVGERLVGLRGAHVYWMEPARLIEGRVTHRRQSRPLDAKERELWDAFPDRERAAYTVELP